MDRLNIDTGAIRDLASWYQVIHPCPVPERKIPCKWWGMFLTTGWKRIQLPAVIGRPNGGEGGNRRQKHSLTARMFNGFRIKTGGVEEFMLTGNNKPGRNLVIHYFCTDPAAVIASHFREGGARGFRNKRQRAVFRNFLDRPDIPFYHS